MKESIYTIPISEVFEPKDGCPICRLRDRLEERCLEYIMGAAMMEPDIRIQTNEAGFCIDHYRRMLGAKNRLSLALMLESHLQWVRENAMVSAEGKKGLFKKQKSAAAPKARCYVCEQVQTVMDTMLKNTLDRWKKDPQFRELYAQQPYVCREHYTALTELAPDLLGSQTNAFLQQTNELFSGYLQTLQEDVTHFCRMYDYRNRGKDWGNSKDAIERAILFLTTRAPASDVNPQEPSADQPLPDEQQT